MTGLTSWLAIGFFAFAVTPISFAGTNRFTAELISKTEPSTNISRVFWHPSGKEVTYLRPQGNGTNTTNVLCSFDVDKLRERVLFDPAMHPVGTNKARLSLSAYQWSPDGKSILVTGDNDLWLVPADTLVPKRLTSDSASEELATFSPDSQRVSFVKQNNLFSVQLSSGRMTQLTSDGSETVLNGKLDWVYGEEFSHLTGSHRAYEWSPDGRQIVYLRLDQSAVPEYPITDFLRTHPTLRKQRYPKAGDTNASPSVRVVSATRSRAARVMPLDAQVEYVLPEFSWTPDARSVSVMTLNRAQNDLSVLLWNPGSGKRRVLLRETDRHWINVFDPPRFLNDGKRFLWGSERDGWYHAYLYQNDGQLLSQITKGPWQIEPEHSQSWSVLPFEIDREGQWLYYSATEKGPRERHVYRSRLDGSTVEELSRDAGTHFQKLSPDGRHWLESFSSIGTPPGIRIVRNDGSVLATLDQRHDRWKDFALATAEYHETTAADGTKLFGQLTKPASFDPAKKYPVIVYVYGGPHAQLIRNQWPAVSTRHQLLAQEGFLIWSLDNRGSWGRGHAWEATVHRNLGTNELSDQLAGVSHLKTLSFVDTNRFGIWGWSYGGYMTLYALTHAPNVFKCGIAGAPVSDWKYYDTIYTERYMSTPKENPAGYKTSSPLAAADKLTAKLLIIHGTVDDNVHLPNTMSFIDALVKAGKPHEIQIQPGQSHGFGGDAATRYLNERIVDFFQRNL
jgi:dipeptidyl-peptidase-4